MEWQRADVFNPAAILKNDTIFVLFRAEDNPKAGIGGRTSRIGLAWSTDGVHFKKHEQPVLFPKNDEWSGMDQPGGCEDPRVVVNEDGLYVMVYTSWNGHTARLSIAHSKDLIHWEKKGPAFAKAYQGKYKDTWSKSGSMLTELKKNRLILKKWKGKYWMYWGEHLVNLAWSENLIDWYPEEDAAGNLKAIIQPRHGYFDSELTECGPPAIYTKKGVILIYNGKNAMDARGSDSIAKGSYTTGELLLDPKNLSTVLSRTARPFLQPSLPHETSGQYKAGTTFAEGLVYFKKQWWLYYGTADSYTGVAKTAP